MAENSKIQWTTSTFNPWRGCTKVSPGCAHCYAEALSLRNPQIFGKWGPNGVKVVASEAQWTLPAKWNKAAACTCHTMLGKSHMEAFATCPQHAGPHVRPRVFCASVADVFEEWSGALVNVKGQHGLWWPVGPGLSWVDSATEACPGASQHLTLDHLRLRLFDTIHKTPNLDWLLLTKRPENIMPMVERAWRLADIDGAADMGTWSMLNNWLNNDPPWNVWLGTSVENQDYDWRVTALCKVPAVVRFLSCEPLLGELDLRKTRTHVGDRNVLFVGPEGGGEYVGSSRNFIRWVIIGGESGHKARPMNLAWARSLVRQCKDAKVPVFVKQLGALIEARDGIDPIDQFPGEEINFRQGRDEFTALVTLGDKKGGDMAEWPADLRVREFPVVRL